MEKEDIIKILIGMMIFVLILIAILIGLNIGNSKIASQTTSQVISNSYNTIDNSKEYYLVENPNAQSMTQIKSSYNKPKENYIFNDWDEWNPFNYEVVEKNYDSFGRHTKEYSLEIYTDTYKVYVYNKGSQNYFVVRFYFENYEGTVKSYDIRKYIYHNDEELFYFRDLSHDKYEYYKWSYKVLT